METSADIRSAIQKEHPREQMPAQGERSRNPRYPKPNEFAARKQLWIPRVEFPQPSKVTMFFSNHQSKKSLRSLATAVSRMASNLLCKVRRVVGIQNDKWPATNSRYRKQINEPADPYRKPRHPGSFWRGNDSNRRDQGNGCHPKCR